MSRLIRAFAGACLALTLIAAPSVGACAEPATPAASRSEIEQLGIEAAHILFQSTDFKALVQKSMGDMDNAFAMEGRPEWRDYMRQAALEEVATIAPTMETIIGRAFADYFTADELRAGVAFLRGPAGPALARVVNEGAQGRSAGPLPADVQREINKLARTAAGRGFIMKFEKIGPVLDKATPEFAAKFALNILHRFLSKADAGEERLHPDR